MYGYTVQHSPEGYACNMRYVVIGPDGSELYRGPEWAANERARTWNAGRLTHEEKRAAARLAATVDVLSMLASIKRNA